MAVVSPGQGSAGVMPPPRLGATTRAKATSATHTWVGAEPGWGLRLGMCPWGREPTPATFPRARFGSCPAPGARPAPEPPSPVREPRSHHGDAGSSGPVLRGNAENGKAALQQNY